MPKTYQAIAEYYDPEYAHLDYLQKDVPFLLSKMPRRPQRVLELATGTGRAAIPLAQAGHTVVGVDIDPGILAIARRKRDFVGLADKQLRLLQKDIRKLRLPDRFDWAVVLFNTLLNFTSVDELDAVLQVARSHLVRGGRLWIDVFNPDLTLISEGYSFGLDPVTFFVPELNRTVSRVTDLEDVSPQVRRVTFHYRWFEEGEEARAKVECELTWMFPRELMLLLERNGFEVEAMYGSYDGKPEVTTTSPRIIALSRKK